MEKMEGRALLKKFQAIVNHRGDGEALDMIEELRKALADHEAPKRKSRGGFDREEKRGLDSSE